MTGSLDKGGRYEGDVPVKRTVDDHQVGLLSGVRLGIAVFLALTCWVKVGVAATPSSIEERFIFLDTIPTAALAIEELKGFIITKPWADSEKAQIKSIIDAVYKAAPGLVERVVAYRPLRIYRRVSDHNVVISLRSTQGLVIPDKYFEFTPDPKINVQNMTMTHEFVHLAEPTGWLDHSSEWVGLSQPFIDRLAARLEQKGLTIAEEAWSHTSKLPATEAVRLALDSGLPSIYAGSGPGEAMAEFVAYDLFNTYYDMPREVRPFLNQHLLSKPIQKSPYVSALQDAFMAWEQNQIPKALTAFDRAIKNSHDDRMRARALVYRGDASHAMSKISEALRDYKEGLALDPTFRFIHYRLAKLYMTFVSYDEAIANFTSYIDSHKGRKDNHEFINAVISRGRAWQEKKSYEKAIADYTLALEIWPGHTEALGRRGIAWRELGKLEKSLADLSRALEIQPHPKGYFERARTWIAMGKSDNKALADINRAVKLDPKSVHGYLFRAIFHYERRAYDKAAADFSIAIASNPDQSRYYQMRGQARYNSKDYDGAIADFSATIEKSKTDKDKVTAYTWRSNAWKEKGKDDKVIADITKLLELDPEQGYYRLELAKLWQKKGDHEKALAVLSTAVEQNPGYLPAHGKRADLLFSMGKYRRAIEAYDSVLALSPDSAQAMFWRGRCWYAMGNLTKAVTDYRKAIKMSPAIKARVEPWLKRAEGG